MCFTFSALTICIVAVLAITTEARHAMKTRPLVNARMRSLIQKMQQRLSDPEDQDFGGHWCGDSWCLEDSWTCCDDDSPYVCNVDPDGCYNALKGTEGHANKLDTLKIGDDCPWPTCPGYYCCPYASYTCCEKESSYICQSDPMLNQNKFCVCLCV